MSTTSSVLQQLKELGLSQSEISRLTGIPQPRLSRWGAGAVPDAADDALTLHRLLMQRKGGTQDGALPADASSSEADLSDEARHAARPAGERAAA